MCKYYTGTVTRTSARSPPYFVTLNLKLIINGSRKPVSMNTRLNPRSTSGNPTYSMAECQSYLDQYRSKKRTSFPTSVPGTSGAAQSGPNVQLDPSAQPGPNVQQPQSSQQPDSSGNTHNVAQQVWTELFGGSGSGDIPNVVKQFEFINRWVRNVLEPEECERLLESITTDLTRRHRLFLTHSQQPSDLQKRVTRTCH